MNIRMLGKLSCKIISIYVFIKFVFFFQNILMIFAYSETQHNFYRRTLLLNSINVGVLLIISLVFWVFADKISDYMVGSDNQTEYNSQIDYEKIEELAFGIIGLVLISLALPNLVKAALDLYFIRNSLLSMGTYYKNDLNYMIRLTPIWGNLVQIIIGFILITKAKFLRKILSLLRGDKVEQ